MNCLFCSLEKDQIILENDLAVAIMDKFPVNEGHMLFIPKRHIKTYFEATVEEVTALHQLLHEGKKYLDEKYHPDGYNIGINVGEDAGQTIMHLHIHMIPRYKGDVKDPRGGIRHLKEPLVPYKGEKTMGSFDNDWIRGYTFGGKSKEFFWKIEKRGDLLIRRDFKSGMNTQRITNEELTLLTGYVNATWVGLYNNVEKLKNNTEKEGLGTICTNTLDWSPSLAMGTSQLIVVMCKLGIWEWNDKVRGICVRGKADFVPSKMYEGYLELLNR